MFMWQWIIQSLLRTSVSAVNREKPLVFESSLCVDINPHDIMVVKSRSWSPQLSWS